MGDHKLLTECCHTMYQGMVQKNEALLDRVLDDSFVLLHMTGTRRSKRQYIEVIVNSTLNYDSEQTDDIDIASAKLYVISCAYDIPSKLELL